MKVHDIEQSADWLTSHGYTFMLPEEWPFDDGINVFITELVVDLPKLDNKLILGLAQAGDRPVELYE